MACVLPGALMVAGLISYNYYQGRAALTKVSIATARAVMSTVDRELSGVQAGLLALATSPYLTSGDLDGLKPVNDEHGELITAQHFRGVCGSCR